MLWKLKLWIGSINPILTLILCRQMIAAPRRDEAVPNPSGVCFELLEEEIPWLAKKNITDAVLECCSILRIAVLFWHPREVFLVELDWLENWGNQSTHQRQQRLRNCVARWLPRVVYQQHQWGNPRRCRTMGFWHLRFHKWVGVYRF